MGVFVLPGGEQHILSALGLIPLVGVSLLIGGLGAKVSGRSPDGSPSATDRTIRVRKWVVGLIGASMVTGAFCILVNSSGEHQGEQGRTSRYEITLSYRPAVTALINEMQANSLVREAYERNDLFAYFDDQSEMGRLSFLAPAVDQFLVSGYRICYVREGSAPSEFYGKSPATSLRCGPSDVRHFALMFASTATSRGFTPLTSIKIPHREGGRDQVAEIVLVQASLVAMSPNGGMTITRPVDTTPIR